MKIIFISNNWVDAHQQTRLRALSELNDNVICLAAFRNYYPSKTSLVPHSLGNIEHASYWKRLKVYIRLFQRIVKTADYGDFVYVFGFDFMLVSFLAQSFTRGKWRVIYEVPDIRELFFSNSCSGKTLRMIEKMIIPRLDLLVVTSPKFVSDYYIRSRKITLPSVMVIENKIHSNHFNFTKTPLVHSNAHKNEKIRIGYFGVLRCPASLHCLMQMAGEEKFEIILRGIFMPSTKRYESKIAGMANINYYGPYAYPDDLESIYNEIDVVWAVYPFSEKIKGNHLLARTNRFYESLFFRKPLILQSGSADAIQAEVLGSVAIEVDLQNIETASQYLTKFITHENLAALKNLSLRIPENHYRITTEYKDLELWLQQNK